MEKFMLSDGMGGFLYIKECEDDNDFITIEIEEEDEDNNYTSRLIEIHKHDIILIINELMRLRSK